MDGQHPVRSAGPHIVPDDVRGRAFPGELGVALVTGDEHAPLPAPGCRGGQVVELPSRVAGAVDPQQQSPLGVCLADRVGGQPQPELVVDRHRYRPQTSQQSSHLVSGVGKLGVKDRVPGRVTQVQPIGEAGHQLLGADAQRDEGRVDADPETACHPVGGGLAGGRRTGRRRVTAGGAALVGRANAARTAGLGGSHGLPTDRSTAPPGSEPPWPERRPTVRRGRAGAGSRWRPCAAWAGCRPVPTLGASTTPPHCSVPWPPSPAPSGSPADTVMRLIHGANCASAARQPGPHGRRLAVLAWWSTLRPPGAGLPRRRRGCRGCSVRQPGSPGEADGQRPPGARRCLALWPQRSPPHRGTGSASSSAAAGSTVGLVEHQDFRDVRAAPISPSTARTASIWPSGSGAELSTRWTSRSASLTTSRVLRKASTSW